MESFNYSNFLKQKDLYDIECDPELIPKDGKLSIRITYPKPIYTSTNRRGETATGKKTRKEVHKNVPNQEYTHWDVALHKQYNKLDKKLGTVHKEHNPIGDLLDEALDRLRDKDVIQDKIADWFYLIDFVLDPSKSLRAEPDEFQMYLATRRQSPFNLPKILRNFTVSTEAQDNTVTSITTLPNGTIDYEYGLEEFTQWKSLTENFNSICNRFLKSPWGDGRTSECLWICEQDDVQFIPHVYEAFHNTQITGSEFIKQHGLRSAIYLFYMSFSGDPRQLEKLEYNLGYPEDLRDGAIFLAVLTERYKREWGRDISPYSEQNRDRFKVQSFQDNPQEFQDTEEIINVTGAPLLSEAAERFYLTTDVTELVARRQFSIKQAVKVMILMIGDLPIDQIQPFHAVRIINSLSVDGWNLPPKVGKGLGSRKPLQRDSIKSNYVSCLKSFLAYVKLNEVSKGYRPKHWLVSNPFMDLKFSGVSKAKEGGSNPCTEGQLYALFNQELSDNDRSYLSLLVCTGLRSAEASSLKWSQISKVKSGHIINLADSQADNFKGTGVSRVKREASRRYVAIHPAVELPDRPNNDNGYIYNFPVNPFSLKPTVTDLWNKAIWNPTKYDDYIHPVNKDVVEDKKSNNSLRKNFRTSIGELMKDTQGIAVTVREKDYLMGHKQNRKDETDLDRVYSKGSKHLPLERNYEIISAMEHAYLDKGKRDKYLAENPFDKTERPLTETEKFLNDGAEE